MTTDEHKKTLLDDIHDEITEKRSTEKKLEKEKTADEKNKKKVYIEVDYIAGVEAEANEFPWMVKLMSGCDNSGQINLCGGSIVSARVFLTAYHCTCNFYLEGRPVNYKQLNMVALLGAHDVRKPNTCTSVKVIDCIFPSYPKPYSLRLEETGQPQNDRHDIAMCIFEKPVTFTKTIAPICLPSLDEDSAGKNAVTAGWGMTETKTVSPVLKKVEQVVSKEESVRYIYNQLTTKLSEKGTTCSGDSGSL